MMISDPPRPVSVPPTEVEGRPPCRVVSKSRPALRDVLSLVAGDRTSEPYQFHDSATVAGMLRGEVFGIGHADDPPRRSFPGTLYGKATEAQIDFSDLGGIVMISRFVSPDSTRSS